MAKYGLMDHLFRTCKERDIERTPDVLAESPVRNGVESAPSFALVADRTRASPRRAVKVLLGICVLLSGLYLNLPQAHAERLQWWALGTFLQPLDAASAQSGTHMQANLKAWALFQDGEAAAKAGEHREAVKKFARAIELYGPQSAPAARVYAKRASSLRYLRRNREAIQALNAQIALGPDRLEGYWARAETYLLMHDFTKALADFEFVAAHAPDTVGAHMFRGQLLHKLSQGDKALGAFEDTIQAAARRYRDISSYWHASVYAKTSPGVVNTTLDLVRRDRDKTIAEAHLWRGKVYVSESKYVEALQAYGEAISAAPDYEMAYRHRGWLNEKTGRIRAARADYQKAAGLNSSDPWIHKALQRVR